jgi:hypothetical protein
MRVGEGVSGPAGHSLAPPRKSLLKPRDEGAEICAEVPADGPQLYHVETRFPALALTNKRLCLVKSVGELDLRKLRALSSLTKQP